MRHAVPAGRLRQYREYCRRVTRRQDAPLSRHAAQFVAAIYMPDTRCRFAPYCHAGTATGAALNRFELAGECVLEPQAPQTDRTGHPVLI